MSQPNVVDEAVLALRRLITAGPYRPGSRLPSERDLAAVLAASRPTVREALRRLAEAGIVETRRGSGTYVAAVDLNEVFAVRLRLEPYAAGLAAEARHPNDLAELKVLLRELKAKLADPVAFADVDRQIHEVLARAADNRLLASMLEHLDELARISRLTTSGNTAVRRETLRHMRQVAAAVKAGRASDANEAMEAHLRVVMAHAESVPSDPLETIRDAAPS